MTERPDLTMVIFGVDFEAEEIVFCSGDRVPVESWRDPLGFECGPIDARVAIFRGPSGLPFAIDIFDCHKPERLH